MTKVQLMALVKPCEEMMRECGFNLPHIDYKFNGRLSRSLARCKITRGQYIIELQTAYFNEALKLGMIRDLRQTILHEMCHAMPNGFNHGAGWLQYVRVINRKFGYNIKTKTQINEAIINCRKERGGMEVVCTKCGKHSVSTRRFDVTKYRCAVCKGSLEEVK